MSDTELNRALQSLEGLPPHMKETLRATIMMGREPETGIGLDEYASKKREGQRTAQADYETTAPATDISGISGHPETQGLYTKFEQPEVPPQTSEALNIENIAQKFFGGGANPEEAKTVIQRTIWEINVLMQSLEFFAQQGVNDPQAALNLMKNKEGSIILYDPSDPYAQWHERQHAIGREMSPEQFKDYIKSNLGSEIPDEAREQVAQGVMDEVSQSLMSTGAYSQADIPSELAAREKELQDRYGADYLDQLARSFMQENPEFTGASPA